MKSAAQEDGLVAELMPAFIQEANEQVASFERLLLELEDDPGQLHLLDALFRCAHTVKGSAGVFGLEPVAAFTHHVESLLDRLREGELALSPSLSTLLLECNDVIRELVVRPAEQDTAEATSRREALIARLHDAGGPSSAAADVASRVPADLPLPSAESRWQVQVRFGADLFRHGMDPMTILSYVSGLGRVEDVVLNSEAIPGIDRIDPESCHLELRFDLLTDVGRANIEHAFAFVREDCELMLHESPLTAAHGLPAPVDTPMAETRLSEAPGSAGTATRTREGSATMAEDTSFIRVHAHRLDEVINLLGELVIAGAGASLLARQTKQRSLIEANRQITRLIEAMRNSTLKLRMVPIGETFARFRRVVRDTASQLGKEVTLEIMGGDTELDKAMVERIADPLMHLIRNALDHGLETPAERVAAGKPAQGCLTLLARHESGNVLIRISDDGRGMQRERILERAWQRGLVEPGVRPPDHEILNLIFEPGFSTAEAVTNLSGRGVGMDVVRSNIEALRGSVAICSEPGRGSVIEIRLPLTLAIIDGFLVGVGSSRFIFPLDSVVEVISSRDATSQPDALGRATVDLRGRLLPVIDLRTLYALDTPPPERGSIVVVQIGTRRYGVMVDALLGQQQTVIKPLGRLLGSLRGISGSSILGTGEVALIFDVDVLGQLAVGSTPTACRPHRTSGPSAPTVTTPLPGDPS